jgi:AcrR family transcriptional regulator
MPAPPEADRQPTVLERQLRDGPPRTRATALDALRLARLACRDAKRIDMGTIAAELGVSRVTLYRWVGSREQLITEALWARTQRTLEIAAEGGSASGGERIAETLAQFIDYVIADPGMQYLLDTEPELVLRLMTRSGYGFQSRLVDAIAALIDEEADAGHYEPDMDVHELAYLLLRIAESYVYRKQITGEDAHGADARVMLRRILR